MKSIYIKTIIIVTCFVLLFFIIFFLIKNVYKTQNFGNNINSKNTDSIVKNILNMQSYNADVEIKIISNKNENTYKMKQQSIKEQQYKQTLQSPAKIEGMEIVFDNNKLEVRNTKLNLSKIYNEYKYLSENALLLSTFINEYKTGNEVKKIDNGDEIVLELKVKDENNKYMKKYIKYKTLYIDKNTGKPTKMEIKDIAQKVLVYILYNEIKINGLQKIE